MKTCLYKHDFTYPESQVHFHLYNTDYPEIHDHDYWEFFIVFSGETKHCCEDREQILTSGMGCLVHPRDKHCFKYASEDYQQMNICITDAYFKELLTIIDDDLYGKLYSINHPIIYEIESGPLEEIYKNIHSLQTTSNTDITKYSNFLKLLWLDIIKLIYRNESHLNPNYPKWLNDFMSELKKPENIVKPVAELYGLTYFSYRHLSRLFKKNTGDTLNEYMQKQKVNYGAMLLRTTDMGILNISSACGYDSLSHFIRIFKKNFNMPPKAYRNSFLYTNKKKKF